MVQVKGGSYTGAELEFDMEDSCQVCRASGLDGIVDGKLRNGPWAFMCVACHTSHGVGFGDGRGQLYAKRDVVPQGRIGWEVEDKIVHALRVQAAMAYAKAN